MIHMIVRYGFKILREEQIHFLQMDMKRGQHMIRLFQEIMTILVLHTYKVTDGFSQ